jgi:hypothetical protein
MGPAAALLAVGLVALAVALTVKLKRRRAPRAPEAAPAHDHYCQGCDRAWLHLGQTCLQHWSWPCEDCRPQLSGPLSMRRTA